jgi:HD-GYP domain-containing protein (c-di-GMP phosphodiesterase class II)
LRGNEIPLGARIVAIADAYDAMTHDRPYKRAMTHTAAIAEMKQHAGTQFDPELVTLFSDLYANEAPTPDPTILAITSTATQELERRERRTRRAMATAETSSATLAAEGVGLVDLGRTERVASRTRRGDGPVTPPDQQGVAAS